MKRFVIGAMAVAMVAGIAVAKMANVSDEDCVKQSALIVVGKVKDVITQEKFPPESIVTVEVSKTLKGKADGAVKFHIPGIAGNTIPTAGEEKIFLLNPQGEGKEYEMAIRKTMFSVREKDQQEKFEKIVAAQAAEKK